MSHESIPDQLIHTTVRLETTNAHGVRGSGTGFILQICKTEDGYIPVVVTNWHVVEGAKTMSFCMTIADDTGRPKFGAYESVTMDNPETMWSRHPDYPAVDLAVLPIAPVLEMFSNKGTKPYFRAFDPSSVADEAYLTDLVAVEDVIMIGYPQGLWDDHNNLPIVRRGITATPPAIRFKNKAEFVIDCACFPGSSGSPVILYNMGGHIAKG